MSIAQDSSVAAIEDATGHSEPKASAPSALPLLLIDDSLSIRKFVGRMLEAAGVYRGDRDGRRRRLPQGDGATYQLIITDLEMPKLNGYEVIQALRADLKLMPLPFS